jgi:hypothetical protein
MNKITTQVLVGSMCGDGTIRNNYRYKHEYYLQNKEHILLRSSKYYSNNRDRVLTRQRLRKELNEESIPGSVRK